MKKIINFRLETEQMRFAGNFSSARKVLLLAALCVVTSIASAQVTFNTLLDFDGTNGANPVDVTLVQGIDGDLYGTTESGGAYGYGTVFKISPSGTLTTLWNFCADAGNNCPDGDDPQAGLTLVPGGDLYGTTFGGGAHNTGTVFKITPSGELTTIYSFCAKSGCADGFNPSIGTALILGTNGDLYGASGTTTVGFFRLTPAGKLTNLYTAPGYVRYPTGVVQASDGNFYLTVSGGNGPDGDIIKITPAGKGTIFYSFCSLTNCLDGANPGGPLVQGANGDLYGTTAGGGAYGNGTFYELTLTGTLTTLHSFDYGTAGNLGTDENSGVILGSDGNFYGVSEYGGEDCSTGCGTVFQITPAGALTTLWEFTGIGTEGWGPWGLMQDTSGILYGTTANGGTGPNAPGTIYSLSDGLPPFVKPVTNYGSVGATIDILGQGFTGTTEVEFGGVSATFSVVSSTELTAVVPTAAVTGLVSVATPGGTLTAISDFKVLPTIKSISPTSGPTGTVVTVTGTGLTGATSVTVDGKSASFTQVSSTEITVMVPSTAKTGKITVTTAGGSASSKTFTVN
jgi:uncharacterized repeat protein (TIGR03803 family)